MTSDDTQPKTLADMIRKKIAEAQGKSPDGRPMPIPDPDADPPIATQTRSTNAPEVGSTLGAYNLLSLLDDGETARIFLAQHSLMDTKVVIKVLNSQTYQDTFMVKRLQEESKVISRMNNPRIVGALDFGIHTSGHPYIVLDFAPGSTVEEMLFRDGKLPAEQALQIIDEVAQALSYMHSQGIKYANLRPSHVLVCDNPDNKISIKLVDFSCARNESSVLPQSITSLYGAQYMSPEQAGDRTLEVQSDVYSLACFAFHILYGAPPFYEASLDAFRQAHLSTPPQDGQGAVLAEGEAGQVLFKALDKDPARRHASVQEFVHDLKRAHS